MHNEQDAPSCASNTAVANQHGCGALETWLVKLTCALSLKYMSDFKYSVQEKEEYETSHQYAHVGYMLKKVLNIQSKIN